MSEVPLQTNGSRVAAVRYAMLRIMAFYLLISLFFPAIHVFVLPALLAAKLFYVSPRPCPSLFFFVTLEPRVE